MGNLKDFFYHDSDLCSAHFCTFASIKTLVFSLNGVQCFTDSLN